MPPRPRSGPPAHANQVKYLPNRGDKHNTMNKIVESLEMESRSGMCRKCTDVVEWKKAYGKFKPLKTPGKCCGCGKKAVDLPYCQLCVACATARQVCPKCLDGKGVKGAKPPAAPAAAAKETPTAAAAAAAADPEADASPSGPPAPATAAGDFRLKTKKGVDIRPSAGRKPPAAAAKLHVDAPAAAPTDSMEELPLSALAIDGEETVERTVVELD